MKGENDVIARCTRDTNITQTMDKGIMRWQSLRYFKASLDCIGNSQQEGDTANEI